MLVHSAHAIDAALYEHVAYRVQLEAIGMPVFVRDAGVSNVIACWRARQPAWDIGRRLEA